MILSLFLKQSSRKCNIIVTALKCPQYNFAPEISGQTFPTHFRLLYGFSANKNLILLE